MDSFKLWGNTTCLPIGTHARRNRRLNRETTIERPVMRMHNTSVHIQTCTNNELRAEQFFFLLRHHARCDLFYCCCRLAMDAFTNAWPTKLWSCGETKDSVIRFVDFTMKRHSVFHWIQYGIVYYYFERLRHESVAAARSRYDTSGNTFA